MIGQNRYRKVSALTDLSGFVKAIFYALVVEKLWKWVAFRGVFCDLWHPCMR